MPGDSSNQSLEANSSKSSFFYVDYISILKRQTGKALNVACLRKLFLSGATSFTLKILLDHLKRPNFHAVRLPHES